MYGNDEQAREDRLRPYYEKVFGLSLVSNVDLIEVFELNSDIVRFV